MLYGPSFREIEDRGKEYRLPVALKSEMEYGVVGPQVFWSPGKPAIVKAKVALESTTEYKVVKFKSP